MVAAANGSAPALCCANIVQIAAPHHQHQHLQRRPAVLQCCRPAHLASRDCRVFADLAPGILQSQAAAAQSIRLLVLKFWLSGRQEARTRQETAPALQIDNVLGAGSTAAAAACCRPTLTAAAQAGYLPLLHSLSLLMRTTNRTWWKCKVISLTPNAKCLPSCKYICGYIRDAEMETKNTLSKCLSRPARNV